MEKIKEFCRKIPVKYYPLAAFILTALTVTLAMSYAQVLSNGKNTVMTGDLFLQLVPCQKMAVNHLLNGEKWTYSWNLFMGQNTTLLYAFDAMSPFTLLFLLIPDIVLATEIIIILKVSMSAFCFCLFLQRGMKEEGVRILFFSICYAMCAYQFQFFRVYSMMDIIYLLPLVMLALLHFIRTKKAFPLIIVYALSFVVHFYNGFLIGIFSGLAFLGILIYQNGITFLKKTWPLIVKYAVSVLSAILLSLMILLPAIYFVVMNASGNDGNFINPKVLPTDCLYAMFLGRGDTFDVDIPYLYCGLPVLLLVPFYFINKKIKLKERLVSLSILFVFLLTLFILPVYQFLHLFNRPDGYTVRYVSLWVFVLVILACRQSKYLSDISIRKVIAMIGFCIVAYYVSNLLNHTIFDEPTTQMTLPLFLINTVFLVAWGGIVWSWKKGKDRFSILFVAMFCIMLECGSNAYLMLKSVEFIPEADIDSVDEQLETVIQEIKQQDPMPQRIACANSYLLGQGMLYDYMSTGGFSSARKMDMFYLMAKLGENVTAFAIMQNGATDVTEMLFGVKYRVVIDDPELRVEGQSNLSYAVNEQTLGFGYLVSDDVLTLPTLNKNAFRNQNIILSAFTGTDCNVYVRADNVSISENGATLWMTGDEYLVKNETNGGIGTIDYEIPSDRYSEAYALFMQSGEDETEVIEHFFVRGLLSKLYVVSFGDQRACHDSHRDLMRETAIVQMEQQEQTFNVALYNVDTTQSDVGYRQALFYYQDDAELDRVYQNLANHQWELQEFDNTYIKSTVSASEEYPVLFTSIPYDEGWHCYVDGVETTPVALLENAFLGVVLTPGEHVVELEYIAPGEYEGIGLAVIGLILAALILLWDLKKKGEITDEREV